MLSAHKLAQKMKFSVAMQIDDTINYEWQIIAQLSIV